MLKKDYNYYNNLPVEKYPEELKLWYRAKTGENLDLDNPKTFNEKIQWLKLYDSTPLKTQLADKYLVRKWVADKIGEEHLVPLLGVWDNVEEINFDQLPEQFALKANHGSGWNIIVKNKSNLNIEETKLKLNKWIRMNYAFMAGFELHYLNIPPKIIAEKYIEQDDQVYDYKFMCFDGVVKYIWVDTERFTNHKRTFFTPKWERKKVKEIYEHADYDIIKPYNFDKMMEFAVLLSKGFSLARVDFYEVDHSLFFGEITFTSGSGVEKITPVEFRYEAGNMCKLPNKSPLPVRLF